MTQFAAAADFIHDFASEVGDAYVTLCVHAGIAAADVICCTRLGEIAQGENHNEAVQLLTRADPSSAKYLQTLLGMKTRAGYSAARMSYGDITRAHRAVEALTRTAERL